MTKSVTAPEGVRILSELEAAEKLVARGWVKMTCEPCNGIGHFIDLPELLVDDGQPCGRNSRVCQPCAGYGWVWNPPPAA